MGEIKLVPTMKNIYCFLVLFLAIPAFAEDPDYVEMDLKKILIAIRDAEGVQGSSLPFLKEINSILNMEDGLRREDQKVLEIISECLLQRYKEMEKTKAEGAAFTAQEAYILTGLLTANSKINPGVKKVTVKVGEFRHFKNDVELTRILTTNPYLSGGGPDLPLAADLVEKLFSSRDPRFALTASEIRLVWRSADFLRVWHRWKEAEMFEIASSLALGRATIDLSEVEVFSAK